MSSNPYVELLIKTFDFPQYHAADIEELLTHEDLTAIMKAIKSLKNIPRGERMITIVCRCYGIDVHRQTLAVIGASLDPPITGNRVREIRNKAQGFLLRAPALRSLIQRIVSAGIHGYGASRALKIRAPAAPVINEEPLVETVVAPPEPEALGRFLFDCFPTCHPEEPCPTCRARELLSPYDLMPALVALAQEWRRGPGKDWRSEPINTEGFSVRTKHLLYTKHIKTLGELCDQSERELMNSPNFGLRSFDEIRIYLALIKKRMRP